MANPIWQMDSYKDLRDHIKNSSSFYQMILEAFLLTAKIVASLASIFGYRHNPLHLPSRNIPLRSSFPPLPKPLLANCTQWHRPGRCRCLRSCGDEHYVAQFLASFPGEMIVIGTRNWCAALILRYRSLKASAISAPVLQIYTCVHKLPGPLILHEWNLLNMARFVAHSIFLIDFLYEWVACFQRLQNGCHGFFNAVQILPTYHSGEDG